MKVGIVIYSSTGHTRSVATQLRETLLAGGHEATVSEVKLAGERKGGSKDFALAPTPRLEGFDALVFGGPVEAFSLTPVMVRYLGQIPSLDRRRVACLVTLGFAYRWMGGGRALRQMRKLCEAKGAQVVGGEAVPWMGRGLEARIARAAAELGRLLTAA